MYVLNHVAQWPGGSGQLSWQFACALLKARTESLAWHVNCRHAGSQIIYLKFIQISS